MSDLDLRIHRDVLGLDTEPIPSYSSDRDAALAVIEHLSRLPEPVWSVIEITPEGWYVQCWSQGSVLDAALAITLPEAICRAALAATEGER